MVTFIPALSWAALRSVLLRQLPPAVVPVDMPQADAPLFVPRAVVSAWAEARRLPVRQAMRECLSCHVWPERFKRNYGLFTADAMRRLLEARIFLAGCGGLGGHAASLLARLGVGALVLCDPDCFEESNLNRQAFCTESTLGQPKALVAQQAVHDMASHAEVTAHVLAVHAGNLPDLLQGADVVLDCLDTIPDKRLLEEAALRAGIPFVHGGVLRHEGFVFRHVPPSPEQDQTTGLTAGRDRLHAQEAAEHVASGLQRLYPQGQSVQEQEAARAAGVSVLSVAGTATLMVSQCLRILLGETAPGLGRLYHLDSGLPELESFAW